MKSIKYILLVSIVFLASCDDFFELERPPQNPWSSIREFERVPIALYASVYGGHHWNIPYANYSMFKVSAGDDVAYVSDPSWGYFRETDQHNTWSRRNFLLLYRTIGTANDALEFVDSHDGNPYPNASLDDITDNFERILGEIYFMRGMAYYYLQMFYGHAYDPNGNNNTLGLPYRITFPENVDEANNPETGTTQQIFDLILSDFEQAYNLLPKKFRSNKHHPSYEVRANKFAAAAMLMKTHFLRGEYDEALDLCDFIIDENDGDYNLTEDPIEAFNKSSVERGREVIFYAPYFDVSLPAPHHLSVLNHTYENGNICDWAETRMSIAALEKLNWIDDPKNDTTFNIEALRDKRFQQLMAVRYPKNMAQEHQWTDNRPEIENETTVWPYKYYRNASSFYTNVPIIRLAEIVLTRSILRFKIGNKAGAAEDLNLVRRRAWDESIGGSFQPISSNEITEDMIHTERMVEMFNEPDRVEYFRALKMDVPPGDRENTISEPYNSKRFVWDIPIEERIYNENIE